MVGAGGMRKYCGLGEEHVGWSGAQSRGLGMGVVLPGADMQFCIWRGKWLLNPSIITGSLQEFPPPESCYTPDAVQNRWLVILGRAGAPGLEALQPRPEDHFEADVLPASWAGS